MTKNYPRPPKIPVFDVEVLPAIIRNQALPGFADNCWSYAIDRFFPQLRGVGFRMRGLESVEFIANRLLQSPSPPIVLINIQHVRGVRFRDAVVFANDHHILVISIGRLEPQIVTTSHNHAVICKGIDDEYLVVNHGMADLVYLRFPSSELSQTCRRPKLLSHLPSANLADFETARTAPSERADR
jgi:hypothetical protein